MRKKLKFKIIDVLDGMVHVKITKQTCIALDFGENHCDYFIASNGYKLISVICPAVEAGECFVRGISFGDDKTILEFSIAEFKEFRQAVAEYNEYSRKKDKEKHVVCYDCLAKGRKEKCSNCNWYYKGKSKAELDALRLPYCYHYKSIPQKKRGKACPYYVKRAK